MRDLDSWDDTALVAYVLRYDGTGLKTLAPALTGIQWTHTIKDLLRKKVEVPARRKTGSIHWNKATRRWVARVQQGRTFPYTEYGTTGDDSAATHDRLEAEMNAWCAAHRRELGWYTERWAPRQFSEALHEEPEKARKYALTDAVATSRLAQVLWPKLLAEPKLLRYYEQFEKPTVPVLAELEETGVLVDPDQLARLGRLLETERELLASGAAITLGIGVSALNSNQQLARALIDHGYRLRHKTPTGQWQVDRATLLELAGVAREEDLPEDTVLAGLLKYRQRGKLKSTYVDALLNHRDANGRVHARFNQMVTDTNRLSSSDPNLQNIPARTALGREIRKAFIARPGYVLVKADFSQLEVRIYAHYTREPALVLAYSGLNEVDVHQTVADELGISRKRAKNVLFGAIYGADAPKLAETAGVVGPSARVFLNRLRERLPSLLTWQESIGNYLTQHGYVETLFGWRNYYPLYWSPIRKEQAEALRQAANLPIQGTAGGILKLLFQQVQGLVDAAEARLVLTVHDEVVYEVRVGDVPFFARKLEDAAAAVTGVAGLSVPLKLEVETGNNWAEMTPWRKWSGG